MKLCIHFTIISSEPQLPKEKLTKNRGGGGNGTRKEHIMAPLINKQDLAEFPKLNLSTQYGGSIRNAKQFEGVDLFDRWPVIYSSTLII